MMMMIMIVEVEGWRKDQKRLSSAGERRLVDRIAWRGH